MGLVFCTYGWGSVWSFLLTAENMFGLFFTCGAVPTLESKEDELKAKLSQLKVRKRASYVMPPTPRAS